MATSLTGQTLGKTTILDMLGHGGMATVYRGYQEEIDRYVAVKVMSPLPGQDEAFVERFKLEARTIARLQHPHILPLYDFGTHDGLLYLITAYAPGGSLSDLIHKGPPSLTTIEQILRDVAGALDYAHRQNVIHRDIKPANILLDREGHALLADFGIVKLLSDAQTTPVLTNLSGIIGTPAYMSPEQANGLPLDGRSDLYALGVVVYELVTGRQPFSAETPLQLLLKHMTEPPPHIGDLRGQVPPALDGVLQRALAKEANDRYATATDFARAFGQALTSAETGTLRMPIPLSTESAVRPPSPATVLPPPQPTTMVQMPGPRGGQTMFVTALLALGAFALALLAFITVSQRSGAQVTQPPPTAVRTLIIAAPAADALGTARFSTVNALGDTLALSANNLAPLPTASQYIVWLVNTDTEQVVNIGSLTVDVQGAGTLIYTDAEGRALPASFNEIVLSVETEAGDAPKGDILYRAAVPASLTAALYSMLVASDDGINGGSLLDGAFTEGGIGRQHAGLAASATNLAGLRLHAEHTINILNGTREDYDGSGRGENPGRGIGLRFFLDRIDAEINAAGEDAQDDAVVQTQVEYIRVCLVNARGWMEEVIGLESELLAADSIDAVEAQRQRSTEAANAMLEGVDLNGNGSVELFEGECSLQQIADSAILAGNLTLRPVDTE